jgi:hypothetical protein
MSIKNRTGLGIVRRARAFLSREPSMTEALRKLKKQEREIAALRAILARREAGEDPGLRPENIIWVFGSGRTGSSWLTFMMGSLPDHSRWNEPLIGNLFGRLYFDEQDDARAEIRQERKHFILGNDYKKFWLSSIRRLLLDGAIARFPERAEKGYLVIKEPHGSIGAPLLMEALPESRMIFLVRDPRDVMASSLDAQRKGSRPSKRRVAKRPESFEKESRADTKPNAFIEARARIYLRDIKLTEQAYEAHKGHKVLIRYEDLKADPLGTMKHIYSALEIPMDEGELARVVEKYSWENVPDDEKGAGKIRRKASLGGWREDLTPKQIEIAERETAQILDQFYAEG